MMNQWRIGLVIALGIASAGAAVAPSAALAVCVGDCDGDGVVRIAEAQRCVNLSSGLPAAACPNGDQNGDGTIDADDVDRCLASFLDAADCPQVATPVHTPTRTNTPAPTLTPTLANTVPPTSTRTTAPTSTNAIPPTPTPSPTAAAIGSHACVADAGSQLTLLAALPLGSLPVTSGTLNVDCGAIGPDGSAACTCGVQSPGLNPLSIAGLFWACVKPAVSGSCPVGTIDCDGGSALGIELTGNRNIGACTSNADCTAQCATRCGGEEFVFTGTAQCEGFCTDGAQSACLTDAACATAGEGSCNGPDGAGLGNICDCTCLDAAAGGPSPAGALQCQLAFNLTVESIPGNGMACDGADVTIRIGDTCAPLTTDGVTATETNANNGGTDLGPFTGTGTGTTCSDLANNGAGAISFKGATQFYASTIGDILTGLTLSCK